MRSAIEPYTEIAETLRDVGDKLRARSIELDVQNPHHVGEFVEWTRRFSEAIDMAFYEMNRVIRQTQRDERRTKAARALGRLAALFVAFAVGVLVGWLL